MPRIRTIKPEFPQSESMGKVSRESRLCFIMLWTLADDEGRLRGSTKMLSSLLFPYDDDAPELISKWLEELEDEECILQYEVQDQHYIEILNWSVHQKIDKPSPSKFPSPNGVLKRNRTERDFEIALCEYLKKTQTLFGEVLLSVNRQVRVESSYLDILAISKDKKFVLELKKNSVTVSDLNQVKRYSDMTGAIPVLIGSGISPQFPISKCIESDVAVLLYDEDWNITLSIPSPAVKECQITLSSVIECYALDQGREGKGKDQGEERILEDASAPPPPAKADPLFHKIRESFERIYGNLPDYPREGKAINRIIKLASGDESVVQRMIEAFYRLTKSSDKYWSSQPFLPSVLSAGGIWPRVKLEVSRGEVDLSWVDELEQPKQVEVVR